MKSNFTAVGQDFCGAFADSFVCVKPDEKIYTVAAAIDDGSMVYADLAQCLSFDELQKANQLPDATERRHFVFRRSFQRLFLHKVLKRDGPLADIVVVNQRDEPPHCANDPKLKLSFSTSGKVALACASRGHCIGIDIEKIRPIENVVGLAERFFTEQEVLDIKALPSQGQNLAFLKTWTAKEAGLKAIGKGIVSGLNTFVRTADGRIQDIDSEGQLKTQWRWTLDYLDVLPQHIVALIHRPLE